MTSVVNPFTLRAAKRWPDNLGNIFLAKHFFGKIFEGEILSVSQTTILLQIFCELLLDSQVIFKSMKVADGTS